MQCPERAIRSACPILLASLAACVAGCMRAPETGTPRVLREVELPVATLAKGFALTVTPKVAGYVMIAVSQENVDVQLQLTGPDAGAQTIDAPGRRAAPERGCIYSGSEGFQLKVTTKDKVAASEKNVRLHVVQVESGKEIPSGSAIEAECLESRAGSSLGSAQDYQRAAALWKARGESTRAAQAHLQAAWAFTRQTQTLAALDEGKLARAEFRRLNNAVGEALANLQIAVPRSELIEGGKDERGEPTEDGEAMLIAARSELESAVATFEAAGMPYFAAGASNYLGANYLQQGDFAEAGRVLAIAATNFEAAGEADGAVLALTNSAIVVAQSGNYRKAVALFDQLLAGSEDPATAVVLGDIFDNSAATHSAAGNYDKALLQFVRALRIHEAANDIPGQVRSLNGLASTYMRLGTAHATLALVSQSRKLLEEREKEKGHEGERIQVTSVLLEGDAHRSLGNIAAARASHEEALKIAGTDVMRVQARLALARDALASGGSQTAFEQIAQARKIVSPEWGTLLLQLQLEHARSQLHAGKLLLASNEFSVLQGKFAAAGAPEFELDVLQGLAQAQFGQRKLDEALATNENALAQLKSLRLASGSQDLRARLNAAYSAAYELRVDLLVAKRIGERDPKQRGLLLAKIFAAADEARSGLSRSASLASAHSTPHNASTERQLISGEIALRQNVLSSLELGASTSPRSQRLRTELASLRTRFDALSAGEAASLPEFDVRDYSTDGLREDSAVLVFLRSSTLIHRYLLTRNDIQELPALPVAGIKGKVAQALAEVSAHPTGSSPRITYPAIDSISGALLPSPELLARRKHLIVVADSITASFPFVALNTAAVGYEPLVASHGVTMALTLRNALRIAQVPDERRRVDLSQVALFSDPVFTALDTRVHNVRKTKTESPRASLPATAKEADQIAALLPPGSARKYSGFDATRAALLSDDVNKATVLHLATHAVANDQWPNGSGLLLTGSEPDGSLVNGYVSTLDLLSRRSVTDLVVLSACDTARGESTSAESVAGLARAFLGGGARRVVAAHWPVEDAVAARFMRGFYEKLAAGETAADALSGAQRAFLTDEMQSPSRWAAFVIYEGGAPD